MGEPQKEGVLQAVKAIVLTEQFRASAQLQALLKYVVEEELAGRGDQIKAYSIGLDAMGRSDDFDPQTDPSVRVAMGRLRSALEVYNLTESPESDIRIEIPKGSYRPVFHVREVLDNSVDTSGNQSERKWFTSARLALAGMVILVAAGLMLLIERLAKPQLPTESKYLAKTIWSSAPLAKVLVKARAQTLESLTIQKEAVSLAHDLRSALSRNEIITVLTPDPVTQNPPVKVLPDFMVEGTVKADVEGRWLLIDMIDYRSSVLVWSRRYQLSPPDGVFSTELVIRTIAGDLSNQLLGATRHALERRDINTLKAPELALLSTWVPGPERNNLAWELRRVDLARRALALSPEFGFAHSVLADKLSYLASVNPSENHEQNLTSALKNSLLAIENSANESNAVFNVAQYYLHIGQIRASASMMERVLELDPNNALARGLAPVIPYACIAAPDSVVANAIAYDASLATDNPIRWVTLSGLGSLHMNRGEYAKALNAEEKAAQIFQVPNSIVRRAVLLNLLGKRDDAIALLRAQGRNWSNDLAKHFADVTMPRICREFPEADQMLALYRMLAHDVGQLN